TAEATPTDSASVSGTMRSNAVTIVNSAPSITGGSASLQYSDPLSFKLAPSDADGDALSFTAIGLPSGMQINATTGEITGTGASNAVLSAPGVYNTIMVTVSDGSGGTQTAPVTITVTKEDARSYY